MSEYRVEKLNDENKKDLRVIYESAFGKPLNAEELDRKLDTAIFGDKNVGFIAYTPDGAPAAFYGAFPCYIRYGNELIYAAQSGDTMTHKDHQGKGLFTLLAKKTYEYARSIGIKTVFGFPNESSYPGFIKKLEWQHRDDMHAYLIRTVCIPFIRLRRWLKIGENIQLGYVRALLSLLPAGRPFQNSVIDETYGGIDHSDKFFRYKSYGKNYLVRIAGRSIWLKPGAEMVLFIGDIERCDEDCFRRILKILKIFCFFAGMPYIRYHCCTGVFHEKYFMKYGQRRDQGYPVGYVDWASGIDFSRVKFTGADNDTF